jgi:hypothetical protein
MKVSESGVYRVLRRHGLNRLPRNAKVRTVQTPRYEKQVPGHHIQVDVKFLTFKDSAGKQIRRFQYTAINDATRIRMKLLTQRLSNSRSHLSLSQQQIYGINQDALPPRPTMCRQWETTTGALRAGRFGTMCLPRGSTTFHLLI